MDCPPDPCLPLSQEERESAKSYYFTLGIDPSHILSWGCTWEREARKTSPLDLLQNDRSVFPEPAPSGLDAHSRSRRWLPSINCFPACRRISIATYWPVTLCANWPPSWPRGSLHRQRQRHHPPRRRRGLPHRRGVYRQRPGPLAPLGNHVSILDLRKLNEDSALGDDLFSRLDGLSTQGIP